MRKHLPARGHKQAGVIGTQLLADIALISLRQLQWWDERGIVTVPQFGHKRSYSMSDALAVCLVAELRRRTFSFKQIRSVMTKLRRDLTLMDLAKDLEKHIANSNSNYLVTDGQRLCAVACGTESLVETLARASRPVVVLDLSDIYSALRVWVKSR